ncbi:MAG: phasin family protein [Pseudolabrys sp.]
MDKSNPNFEVSPEMRDFAEKSVEQAKKAIDGFIAAARHAAVTVESQGKDATGKAKEAGDLAMRYAERNIDSSFEFAQSLVRAKDVQEVMKLQSDYMTKQMTVLQEQAKDLRQKAAKTTP